MATLAFVVIAHRNPRQLGRLLQVLGPERCYVHLDSGLAEPAHAALAGAAGAARLLPRHRSAWASWNIVAAILDGFRAALSEPAVTHVGVLSGQDYPLVPVRYMESLLPPDASFVRPVALPHEFWGRRGGFDRLDNFNWAVRHRRLQVPARRKVPGGIVPHAGSPWSLYLRRHVESVLAHADEHAAWWRRVWIPDELLVSSVVATRHPDELLNSDPGYTEWTPGIAHPRTFTSADVDRLVDVADQDVPHPPGRKWFARKFDDDDLWLLSALDERLIDVPLRHQALASLPPKPRIRI